MKEENAIEVRNVRKSFKVFLDRSHTMKELMLFRNRRRYENRVVLDNISFSVKKGEAVGLIGHNGCGKSTTLKLLTRIIYPDSGEIEMKGRVSSLIELGAGFHPDMSGRENIYINASIFGLTKQEIDRRLEDIIRFSELEDYIDNPVRTYSSGMYMRLAFSVAINVDADILLIDEILAVGDASFQEKCFKRMKKIKESGTTIVLVSHALGQIEDICDRTIWINDHNVFMQGPPKEVHEEYLFYMSGAKRIRTEEERRQAEEEKRKEKEKEEQDQELSKIRYGNMMAEVTKVELFNTEGEKASSLRIGDDALLTVSYKVHRPVKDAVFGIGIFREDGLHCYGTNTRIDGKAKFDLTQDGRWNIWLRHVNLLPGKYWINVSIEMGEGIPVDFYKQVWSVEILSPLRDIGVTRIDHEWEY